MSSSDWIALAAGVISLFALGLGGFTYVHQRHQDKSNAEQDLADQIADIQKELAKLGPPGASDRSIDLISKSTTVNTALQGLVLRIAALIRAQRLEPDWFQTAVLANAYTNIGDMAGGTAWVDRAVKLAFKEQSRFAKDAPDRPVAAVVVSLRMQGIFFFERSGDGDADRGREALERARSEVEADASRQGPVLTRGRLIELMIGQAFFELGVGANERAVDLIQRACAEWQQVKQPAGRHTMCVYITTFLRNQQGIGPGELTLPAEFVSAMEKVPPEAWVSGANRQWSKPLPDAGKMHSIVEAALTGPS